MVSSRSTLPILSNILLQAKGDKLTLVATDLDMTIQTEIEATVKTEGSVTAPAAKLLAMTKELTGEIDFTVDDKSVLRVEAGSSDFKVRGLPTDEFPPVLRKANEQAKVIDFPFDEFKAGLARIVYAQSTDESRYVLNGVFLQIKEGVAKFVATDGRRIAIYTPVATFDKELKAGLIIPAKAIEVLKRVLGEKGSLRIYVEESTAHFLITSEAGDQTTFTTKLVEGVYPNFNQVIPTKDQYAENIELPNEAFRQALRGAALMTSEKSNSVKLLFTKNQVTITANSPEVGEAKEELTINYKGKDQAISFNPDYLVEPLQACPEEHVTFHLIDELSPGVIENANGSFLYVVMPCRLSDSPPVVEPKKEEETPAPEQSKTTKKSNGKKKAKNNDENEPVSTNSSSPTTPAA